MIDGPYEYEVASASESTICMKFQDAGGGFFTGGIKSALHADRVIDDPTMAAIAKLVVALMMTLQ
jgi:cyanophycinase-like exopeptidase